MRAASRDPARLRVVTWNIRAAIGPGEPFPSAWWRHVRRDRLAAIGRLVRDLDVDLATLQEVTVMNVDGDRFDQPADLAASTGLHVRYGAVHAFALVEPDSGRSIGTASWGNAILSRKPIHDGFAIGLPRAADDDLVAPVGSSESLAGRRYGDAEPGHREPRCAVGGRLGIAGPLVVTTHLTYCGRQQRLSQAAALARILQGGPGPAIVTGDFNAPLDADELGPLGDLADAFGATGTPIGDPARASAGSLSIDHVLVRGFTVEECRVITAAGSDSDHLPVLAVLSSGSA